MKVAMVILWGLSICIGFFSLGLFIYNMCGIIRGVDRIKANYKEVNEIIEEGSAELNCILDEKNKVHESHMKEIKSILGGKNQ